MQKHGIMLRVARVEGLFGIWLIIIRNSNAFKNPDGIYSSIVIKNLETLKLKRAF